MLSDFFKNEPTDQIWWIEDSEVVGEFLFSFDKKTIFNFFEDYPHKLTNKQVEIFKKENPMLAELKET